MATDLAVDDIDLDDDVIDYPSEVLTLEDFLRLPEIKPALEFIDGRIEQKMSPNLTHSIIETRFPAKINAFAEPAGLGVALVELRCSFDGESYVPDISFFLYDRLPIGEDGHYQDRVMIPPDLSIEILSPGQTVTKLSARLHRLVEKGVRLGILVQPRKSRVLIFRPGQETEEVGAGGILTCEPVLPGFTLPLDELFGWLTPRRG
jgi:Uma2 family endonuclease